jgi:hypothetical protein
MTVTLVISSGGKMDPEGVHYDIDAPLFDVSRVITKGPINPIMPRDVDIGAGTQKPRQTQPH